MNMKFLTHSSGKKRTAFTLAETLITIMVIGVIAAIMVPALSYLIHTKVREHQVSIFQKKFNKGLEMMMLNGKMGPYYSDTYDFVKELSNHLKLTQICRVGDSPSSLPPISACFGDSYDKITINSDGDTTDIASITTGSSFGIDTQDDTNDWTSDNIAILTIDGNRMILSYNTKCPEIEAGVYATTTAEGCIAGVADIDGAKKPNKLNDDVYLFGNARSLGDPCVIGKQIGLCYAAPINISSGHGRLTYSECLDKKDELGLTDDMCWSGGYNFYAYAAYLCGGMDKLLNAEDAVKMINYVYGTSISVSAVSQNLYGMGYKEIATISNYDDGMATRLKELGLGSLDSDPWRDLITNVTDTEDGHRELELRKTRVETISFGNYGDGYQGVNAYVLCKVK